MNSRRRVNSTVIPLRFLKTKTKQREACRSLAPRGLRSDKLARQQRRHALPFLGYRKPVARYNPGRDNKSLNRSGVSGLLIRKTRMLLEFDRRPVNSTVGPLIFRTVSFKFQRTNIHAIKDRA